MANHIEVVKTTEITSIMHPVFIIVVMPNVPLENVTVFGGVEVGRMNAREHAIVTGMMHSRGFLLDCTPICATIGIRIVAAAEFDTSSVNSDTTNNSTKTLVKGLNSTNGISWAPTHKLKPVVSNPDIKRGRGEIGGEIGHGADR